MYILKNSLLSIIRNKGRNILIGIAIFVIACASTVTLAIRNTANNLVKSYEEAHDIIATISFDRKQLAGNFKGGEEAQRENIENFNNIESFTLEDVQKYGESEYLKDYYYIYTTSLNSDSLTKATDSIEYEVEEKQTIPGENNRPTEGGRMQGGQEGSTTVITRSKEKFESARNLNRRL